MKNIYKKIARKIFMHAFFDELVDISTDIVDVEKHIVKSDLAKSYAVTNKALGQLDVLKRLDLLL